MREVLIAVEINVILTVLCGSVRDVSDPGRDTSNFQLLRSILKSILILSVVLHINIDFRQAE